MPVGRQGLILLEGRPVEGPCPLPFDVPFRIGSVCLTLHGIVLQIRIGTCTERSRRQQRQPISLIPLSLANAGC